MYSTNAKRNLLRLLITNKSSKQYCYYKNKPINGHYKKSPITCLLKYILSFFKKSNNTNKRLNINIKISK